MEIWLIILLAILGVLLLGLVILFFGTAHLRVICQEDVSVGLQVLFLRFRLYPQGGWSDAPRRFCRNPNRALAKEMRRQRKDAKRAEKKRQKKKRKAAETAYLPKPNLADNLTMVLALTKDFYREAKGKIAIRALRIHVVVASDNAAKTALLWGGVSASATLLLDWIDTHFAPIERAPGDIAIRPDYNETVSGADIDLVFSITLWRALRIALSLRDRYTEEKTKAYVKAARRTQKKARKQAANQSS